MTTHYLFFPINLAADPANCSQSEPTDAPTGEQSGHIRPHPATPLLAVCEQSGRIRPHPATPLLAVCDRSDFPLLAGPAFDPETGFYVPGSRIAPAHEWFCKPYGSLYRRFYDDKATNALMAEKTAKGETDVKRVALYRKDLVDQAAFGLAFDCCLGFRNHDHADLRRENIYRMTEPAGRSREPAGSTLTALEGYAEALQRRIADAPALQAARKRGGRQACLTDARLKEFLDDCQELGIAHYSLRQLRFELQDTYGAGTLALGDIGRLLTGQYRRLPGYDYSSLVEVRKEENLRAYRRPKVARAAG